jgi:hypothetical protein
MAGIIASFPWMTSDEDGKPALNAVDFLSLERTTKLPPHQRSRQDANPSKSKPQIIQGGRSMDMPA